MRPVSNEDRAEKAKEAEEIPLKYQRRRNRLRPVFPQVDWMIVPNSLAYIMSWYGLFIGKFPVQSMCLMLGMGFMFAAGLSRITIVEMMTSDFLPTDSPSIKEREKNVFFDINDREDPSDYAMAMRPLLTAPPRIMTTPGVSRNGSTFRPSQEMPVPTFNSRKKRQSGLKGPGGIDQSCRVSAMLIVAKQNASDPSGRSYNLYEKAMLAEIEKLENLIYDMVVDVETTGGYSGSYKYEDGEYPGVCTKQPTGECGGFTLRVMRGLFRNSEGRDPLNLVFSKLPGIGLTWPSYQMYDLSPFFGKVETVNGKPNGMVKHIGAMREVFCVNEYYSDYFMRAVRIWERWEKMFDKTMRGYRSQYFDVYWLSDAQKKEEQNTLVATMVPRLLVTFVALMVWCAVGALMGDAVRSKPWAGFIGVFSTLIACAAGFGIQLWMDPDFKVVVMVVPLLTLAIGLDDMFIMFEAWSATNPKLPIEERMMLCMNTGGTSIVITFFINLLDFVIGNNTPFPVIKLISEYAIATMVLDFFFQMTVFAPCLVLLGRMEEKNKHSCCGCATVPSRERSYRKRGGCFLVCCAGGQYAETMELIKSNQLVDPIPPTISHEEEESNLLKLIVNVMATLPFRIVSLGLFVAYLGLAAYSIMQLEVGLKAERIFRTSSNLFAYTQQHRLLFTGYGKEVTVNIFNEVDYADPVIRRKLIDTVDRIEQSGYFWSDTGTQFWLRDFLEWCETSGVNVTAFETNEDVLREIERFPGGFLESNNPRSFELYGSMDKYGRSIRKSKDGTRIMKTRFKIRAKDLNGPARQMGMMNTLRDIINTYRPDIEMYSYNDEFNLYDQFETAIPTTLYYCGITLAVTVAVALMMIPHPACIFWVAVFVATVLAGIIGLMRLWEMDLDSVSLINLLVAISFCSDLIAHPIYIFMISPADYPDGRPMTGKDARVEKSKAVVREVLGAAIPACVGTTLSVIAMSTSDAYIFITFFRVMFLSVILSILHALIFVPAFLSFIGPSDSRLQVSIGSNGRIDDVPKNEVVIKHADDSAVKKIRQRFRGNEKSSSSSSSSQSYYYNDTKPMFIKRGGLGGLKELAMRPPRGDVLFARPTNRLPPTIAKFPNSVPPRNNPEFNAVKAELRKRSLELQERERKMIQRKLEQAAPKQKKPVANIETQKIAIPKEVNLISERLKRWIPPAVTTTAPTIPPQVKARAVRQHHPVVIFKSSSSSGLGPSASTPGNGSQNNNNLVFNSSRTGALMLPARHRFNM